MVIRSFFLSTDSAPHSKNDKESSCGCAGCFSHPAAIELYTEVFDQAGALDKLEAFASINGADFYQLPYNKTTITMRRQDMGCSLCLYPLWTRKLCH